MCLLFDFVVLILCCFFVNCMTAHIFLPGGSLQWTSDEDLIVAVREAGLKDVICIKFYETRANGQSKGSASCVCALCHVKWPI